MDSESSDADEGAIRSWTVKAAMLMKELYDHGQ